MRLDTFGPTADFIIHMIAVTWWTAAWIVPIGIFWIYVIYPELTWPLFFIYFIFCFYFFYYIYQPFLYSFHIIECNVLEYLIAGYFFVYYIFFCLGVFDGFKTFEQFQKNFNKQLVDEEEERIKEGFLYFNFFLFTIIPIFFSFCLFFILIFYLFLCKNLETLRSCFHFFLLFIALELYIVYKEYKD